MFRHILVPTDVSAGADIAIQSSMQCDLIAIASHGRKDARAVMLGRGTQEVLARSQMPVPVFR